MCISRHFSDLVHRLLQLPIHYIVITISSLINIIDTQLVVLKPAAVICLNRIKLPVSDMNRLSTLVNANKPVIKTAAQRLGNALT